MDTKTNPVSTFPFGFTFSSYNFFLLLLLHRILLPPPPPPRNKITKREPNQPTPSERVETEKKQRQRQKQKQKKKRKSDILHRKYRLRYPHQTVLYSTHFFSSVFFPHSFIHSFINYHKQPMGHQHGIINQRPQPITARLGTGSPVDWQLKSTRLNSLISSCMCVWLLIDCQLVIVFSNRRF